MKSTNIKATSQIGIVSCLLFLLLFCMTGCPEKGAEADAKNPDINGPQTVKSFTAKSFTDYVELNWDIPTEKDSIYNKDLAGMLIVRAEGQQPLAQPYRGDRFEVGDELGLGEVVYIGGDETFFDEDVNPGTTYYYEIFTFDEIPNYGESAVLNATPGSPIHSRIAHSQTRLADGRILLVGGVGFGGPMLDGEIYDPTTGLFAEIVDEMRTSRFDHTATLLDDGRVLIIGGYEEGFLDTLDTAEIFDPETETFTWVDSKMALGRASHTATLLPDGTVLVVGGTDGYNGYKQAEIFDPETESFTVLDAQMIRARYDQTATIVMIEEDPYVFIAGGFGSNKTLAYATFFDPALSLFTDFAGSEESEDAMTFGRLAHTATLLNDGRVLIAGGFVGTIEAGDPTALCERFDSESDTPIAPVAELFTARSGHAAVLLNDGRVLVVGGIDVSLDILDSSEIFDPDQDLFTAGGTLNFRRTVPMATLLDDGTVFVAGGNDSANLFDPMPVSAAEIFDPTTETFSVVGH